MIMPLVFVVMAAVSAVAEPASERIRLTEPRAFVTAFLQAEDGSTLLATAPAAATAVRYSLTGARIEEVNGSTDFDPSGLASGHGGYLVQNGQACFAALLETRERGQPRFATRCSAELLRSETTVEQETLRSGQDLAKSKEIEGDIARVHEWTPIEASTSVANADVLLEPALMQEIPTMLRVVSAWIETPRASPLSTASKRTALRESGLGTWQNGRKGELEAAEAALRPGLLAERQKRIFLSESPSTEAQGVYRERVNEQGR